MTLAMWEETLQLSQDCRITHGEWIRRCMYWGLKNGQHIHELEIDEPYRLPPQGRPPEK